MISTHVGKVRLLYKTILRLHRGLPQELKLLGDNYVKDEFRRHKNCGVEETKLFMNEWANYALSLADQLGLRGPTMAKPLGATINEEDLEKMSDEQINQLYELMLAAQGETNEEAKIEDQPLQPP